MNASDVSLIRRNLLRWYRRHRRDLPWRRTRDPYAILVSEVMLQQTRVEAVIPCYESFLRRFPSAAALAEAPLEDVLAAWSGLGYYRRARSLHSAAREMVARYGGRVPEDEEAVRALPGVGPYTAGALLSIAYGRTVPILDGNVVRLLSRLFCIHGDPGRADVRARLWRLAERLLPEEGVGDFNQALMELPALVCTPRSPRCEVCPLEGVCRARRGGLQERLPERRHAARSRSVEVAFACAENRGRYFLRKRLRSPMQGMWEFPSVEAAGPFFAPEALRRELRRRHGLAVDGLVPRGTARHSIMDRRIRAHFFLGKALRRRGACGRWVAPERFSSLPVTTLTRKGLRFL